MAYRHILLIDDDEDDQEIFLTAMKRLSNPVPCTAFGDAEAALKKLEDHQLTTDLIFLDLNMPVMSGIDFLKKLKTNDALKAIPVIVFSTSSHPNAIKEARDLGALDFITKPDKFEQLVTILRSLIL
jgi:CheY-like chemotaxis protein